MNCPTTKTTPRRLGLFAKYWEPGKVKTRLAQSLGATVACELYYEFLESLVRRPVAAADQKLVFFSPHESEAEFKSLVGPHGWQLKPQSAGDLGARLIAAVRQTFSESTGPFVIIGSDSPNLPAAVLEQAFESLCTHDIVLGPTEDGGYYLVGMSGAHVEIFDEIQWSTEQVWEQTVAHIERSALTWQPLPIWYDVDELSSLERLRDDLGRQPEPRLEKLRAAIETALER